LLNVSLALCLITCFPGQLGRGGDDGLLFGARCNSVAVLAADESAARTFLAGSAACAAGVTIASADPLDFRNDL
jgi:hypothetical protein